MSARERAGVLFVAADYAAVTSIYIDLFTNTGKQTKPRRRNIAVPGKGHGYSLVGTTV